MSVVMNPSVDLGALTVKVEETMSMSSPQISTPSESAATATAAADTTVGGAKKDKRRKTAEKALKQQALKIVHQTLRKSSGDSELPKDPPPATTPRASAARAASSATGAAPGCRTAATATSKKASLARILVDAAEHAHSQATGALPFAAVLGCEWSKSSSQDYFFGSGAKLKTDILACHSNPRMNVALAVFHRQLPRELQERMNASAKKDLTKKVKTNVAAMRALRNDLFAAGSEIEAAHRFRTQFPPSSLGGVSAILAVARVFFQSTDDDNNDSTPSLHDVTAAFDSALGAADLDALQRQKRRQRKDDIATGGGSIQKRMRTEQNDEEAQEETAARLPSQESSLVAAVVTAQQQELLSEGARPSSPPTMFVASSLSHDESQHVLQSSSLAVAVGGDAEGDEAKRSAAPSSHSGGNAADRKIGDFARKPVQQNDRIARRAMESAILQASKVMDTMYCPQVPFLEQQAQEGNDLDISPTPTNRLFVVHVQQMQDPSPGGGRVVLTRAPNSKLTLFGCRCKQDAQVLLHELSIHLKHQDLGRMAKYRREPAHIVLPLREHGKLLEAAQAWMDAKNTSRTGIKAINMSLLPPLEGVVVPDNAAAAAAAVALRDATTAKREESAQTL